jgi:LacI family fructose operon transcriptional repressor
MIAPFDATRALNNTCRSSPDTTLSKAASIAQHCSIDCAIVVSGIFSCQGFHEWIITEAKTVAGESDEISKRPTIYDVARLAETSPSAVSSILNGTWKKRRISEKLANHVTRIAKEQGYATNIQARALRQAKSNIIGMIIPKYDNRYFGAIAEHFEALARSKGLFPVVTCTQRDPDLEVEAAKELISYQVETLIATGATDPDRITGICKAAGVRSINLDLPGSAAASVISDNYTAAKDLTKVLLDRCEQDLGWIGPLTFVGGRLTDHNTAERLRGSIDAQTLRGIEPKDINVLARGYSAEKAEDALISSGIEGPAGLFINSTISLEGAMRWYQDQNPSQSQQILFGCFDWDPFGKFLPGNVGMIQQDVDAMLDEIFELIATGKEPDEPVLVPCIFRSV